MKLFILIFLIFISSSCSVNRESDRLVNIESLSYKDIEIKIPNDVYNSFLHTQVYSDSLLYGLNPGSPFEISVFDLKKNSFKNKIAIDSNFFKEKIGAFYVHTPDNIFVTGMNYPLVYIISSKGKIINTFDLKEMESTQDFIIPSLFSYTSPFYDAKSDQLYITTLPYDWDRLSLNNQSFERVFNLKSKTLDAKYSILSSNKLGVLPYDLNIPYRLVTEKTIVISHPVKETINIYDRTTFQLVETRYLETANPIDFPEPVPMQNIADEQVLWNYRITTPFYEPIFYHNSQKVFSRILHHAQELKIDGVTLNNGEKRKATLFLYDSNFKFLTSYQFDKGTLGIRKIIPLSNGLLVAPHESYWKNEDLLVYSTLYEF